MFEDMHDLLEFVSAFLTELLILFFIYTIFKEDTQLASKASLPCGILQLFGMKNIHSQSFIVSFVLKKKNK